jgi:soluble lytic murein transglycosylase-like protein
MPDRGNAIYDLVRPVTVYQIGDGVPWNEWEANLTGAASVFRSYDIASAAERSLNAYRDLYTRQTDIKPTKNDLVAHLYAVCDQYRIDRRIAYNQITAESSFNESATGAYCVLGSQNRKCAIGVAQFIPATARAYGLRVTPQVDDRYDGIKLLDAYGALMRDLLDQFGGDYMKALAAYNAGSATVDRAVARNGEAWLSAMPVETQNYVARILGVGATGAEAGTLQNVLQSAQREARARIGVLDILTSDLGPDLLKRWALFVAAMWILLIALLPQALRLYKKYKP